MRGGSDFRGWGPDRYLRTELINAVNDNTYTVVSANSEKRKKPKPFPRVPTPDGDQKKKEDPNTFAAIAKAKMAAKKQRREGQ